MIADKMERGIPRYIVIRNENASSNYTTEFIHALYNEEAKGRFSTRVNVLGHMQQVSYKINKTLLASKKVQFHRAAVRPHLIATRRLNYQQWQ